MTPLRMLCLFSSATARDASFFAQQDGHWITDLDAGPCEFVPLVVDGDMPALACSGLFTAATLLCRPDDLVPTFGAALRAGAEAFRRAGLPLELVAEQAPVTLLGWLSDHALALVDAVRTDGEARPSSPSWWRDRARGHLARGASTAQPMTSPPEDLGTQLRDFVARRGW